MSHADYDAGENGGAMTDGDYYDAIAKGEREDNAMPGQAAREELEATFRRTFALHPGDFKAKYEQARDAVMAAADTYAQAAAAARQPQPALDALREIERDAERAIDTDDSLSLEHVRDLARNGRKGARQPQPAPGLLQSAYLYHCKFGGLGGDEYGLFWRKEDADAAAANRAGEGRTEVLGMAILGDQPEQPATGLAGDTEPVMAPAVVRPLFGSTLVLAIHPDQDDEAARRGEEAIRAATEGEGVTVVTVRGVEALRTWEPPAGAQPAPRWTERLGPVVLCEHSPAELGVTVSGEPQPVTELAAAMARLADELEAEAFRIAPPGSPEDPPDIADYVRAETLNVTASRIRAALEGK